MNNQDIAIRLHNLSQQAKAVHNDAEDISKILEGRDVFIRQPGHKYNGRKARVNWVHVDRGQVYVYVPPYKLYQEKGRAWVESTDWLNDNEARRFILVENIELCP